MSILESITTLLAVYALITTLPTLRLSTKKLLHWWRTRHLQKVWGIKDGDSVIVVCSELDNPKERQLAEPPREFIYSLKYGDVDAYFEVVTTLLRLYPAIKLRIMSAGEATAVRFDLASHHLILIGGPDYNALTQEILNQSVTQFDYRSPDGDTQSEQNPQEIVLYDKQNKKEYCFPTKISDDGDSDRDYGYFERIANPRNPKKNIVLIGGCHTIGVTGAIKAFSMAPNEEGKIQDPVLSNAELVAGRVGKAQTFAVVVLTDRVLGQTISTPVVKSTDITMHPDG